MLQGKEYPELPGEISVFVESFIGEVKLRRFPFKVPPLSISPWKKSNLTFRRARIKTNAYNFCFVL